MIVRNTSERDADIESLIEQVLAAEEEVHITGRHGKAVLLSEEQWRSITETLHLTAIAGMIESIQRADAEPIDEGTPLKDLQW
mgnify:CR=1 FL=1